MKVRLDQLGHALRQAVICALVAVAITTPLGIAYIATLPGPEAGASAETQESYRTWKRSMRIPVAFVCLVLIPGILAAARFASTYPADPLPFWICALVTAFAAGIAHVSTMPIKGGALVDYLVALAAAIAAAMMLAFRRSARRDDGVNANS
ncbi:MAG: hypothetical protein KDB14_01365 [Planctomycetales bacterium]|nr:hypothetical protein [Planctomycetales bacterium]